MLLLLCFLIKIANLSQVVVTHTFILEGRGRWTSELVASLVYQATSRIVKAIQRNPETLSQVSPQKLI